MKKIIPILIGIIICLGSFEYVSAKPEIVSSAVMDGNHVRVTGQILNVLESRQITIVVGAPENILYIGQTGSDEEGFFEFVFDLPEGCSAGFYELNLGSDSEAEKYTGSIRYEKQVIPVTNKFADIDLMLRIQSYVPYIEGNIECADGKTMAVSIKNITDGTTIVNDVMKGGNHIVAYQLPSLISAKEYIMTVVCYHGVQELFNMNINIDSSILTVSAEGSIDVTSGIRLNSTLRSNNSDLINKSVSITEDGNVNVTLPNIIANTSFTLTADGYETISPVVKNYKCNVTGRAGDVFNMTAVGNNIASFDNKTFMVTYNDEQIEAVSLYGKEDVDSLVPGITGNVEIKSYNPGEIRFGIVDTEVPEGELWNGILNIFKFKFKSGYSGNTEIIVSE